jgi:uncharacterized protein (TIGR02246 family)
MAKGEPEKFIDRYRKVWADVSPSAYADLYHPDGAILLPDGSRISRDQIVAFMEQILRGVPDLSLVVENWAARGDTLLLEWRMRGTAAGGEFELRGADRFTLKDDLVVESIAYYDPAPLIAKASAEAVRDALSAPAEA